jgi:hypothetical protein
MYWKKIQEYLESQLFKSYGEVKFIEVKISLEKKGKIEIIGIISEVRYQKIE